MWAISSKTVFVNTEEKARIIAGLRWIGYVSKNVLRGKPNVTYFNDIASSRINLWNCVETSSTPFVLPLRRRCNMRKAKE